MSNAVATTGILVKRSTGTLPITKAITTSTAANPTVITATGHGLATGDPAIVAGHTGSTPSINGNWRVTVLTANTFSIPVTVSVAGTGGTVQPPKPMETIAELVNVTPPGFSRNKIETTTHNDGTESNILGILRQEDAAMRVNYVGSELTHQHLISDMLTTPSPVNTWQVVFPSGVIFQGDGRVSRFKPADAPPDAAQQADISIVWSGPIAWFV